MMPQPTPAPQLKKELLKRAYETVGDNPIHLVFEHDSVFNMTFIDTPSLDTFYWGDNQFLAKKKDSEVETSMQIQNLILRLVNNSDRMLLFVEECKDKSLMSIASRIASAVDPVFVRSIFVYSKFHNKLRDFYTVNEVNSYLASAPKNAQTFFVSLPSTQVRNDVAEDDKKFRKRLAQAYLRDIDYLDLLQYNTEYAHMVGIHRIRRHIQHVIRRKYRETCVALSMYWSFCWFI
jgi:hypothetical protein